MTFGANNRLNEMHGFCSLCLSGGAAGTNGELGMAAAILDRGHPWNHCALLADTGHVGNGRTAVRLGNGHGFGSTALSDVSRFPGHQSSARDRSQDLADRSVHPKIVAITIHVAMT